MISIRQHDIAQAAFDHVTLREKLPQTNSTFDKKKYGGLVHKLPMMILQNGLAQATGFLMAKNSDKTNEHLMLLDDLAAIVDIGLGSPSPSSEEDKKEKEVEIGKAGKELHQSILATDIQALTRLTRVSLDASGALRRYVQGVMHIDATGEEQQEDNQQKMEA